MASSSFSPGGSQVTIDRDYFETLLRRAQFNTEPPPRNGYQASVVLSRAEYDRLVSIAKQYGNLTRNLLRGGVTQETVDLLSQDDETIQAAYNPVPAASGGTDLDDGGVRLNPPPRQQIQPPKSVAYVPRPDTSNDRQAPRRPSHEQRSSWADVDGEDGDDDDGLDSPLEPPPGADYVHQPQYGQRQQFERQCSRTVQLSNLAEGTTHADITAAVRGGMLLDIFMRSHDRTAAVSFVNSADARKFLDHVRRNDLYIRNKRIEVKWNDRQFVLPGHVANKIAVGASRNLILHGYDSRHTEEIIREDLDHIHNLVVIKVEFSGGNCHISLNSIHNAIYARQCMMSRLRYKGKKITYDVDECAQPYPQPAPVKTRNPTSAPKKPVTAVHNRFNLLALDDVEDEDLPVTTTAHFQQAHNAVGITA
ncbi:hypothetical protein VTJ04DRAFT_242 [Mycothermus thermophilus]|uniref:uncharacterized protein n=1 Tax=Humicola insolens TaxID=85995 RepID=UPI0037428C6A